MALRIFPIYLVVFIAFVGYALTATLFPPLVLHPEQAIFIAGASKQARLVLLGVLVAIYPLAQFIGSPIIGALADHHGRRPVLIVSVIVTAVAYVGIALGITFHSLALLMPSVALAGFAEANMLISQSVIADITTKKERGRLFSYIYLSRALAFTLGPFLGGWLAHWMGFAFPFWMTLILLFITLIWILVGFRETLKEKQHIPYSQAFFNLKNIFTDGRLRGLFLINFFIFMALFGFFRAYPMYLVDSFGFGAVAVGEHIAWLNLPIAIGNVWLMGYLLHRFSPRSLALWGSLAVGVTIVILALPSAVAALWITSFLVGCAFAFALPSGTTLLSTTAQETEQGRVMGNNQAILVFAEGISSLMAGFLAAIAIKLPIFVCAGFGLLAAATLVLRRGRGAR